MDTSTNKQTMSEEDVKLKFITPNRESKPARMRRNSLHAGGFFYSFGINYLFCYPVINNRKS
jgi:hypothetical protein